MKTAYTLPIFDNPAKNEISRQAQFPCLCLCNDKTLLSSFVIGTAPESVDSTSYISKSTDGGKTWSEPKKMFDQMAFGTVMSDCCKLTLLPDGRIIALGYGFLRENPELPEGNINGGLLDDVVFCSFSDDNGETWSEPKEIECYWGRHVEASAPLIITDDNDLIAPITGFCDWDGKMTGKICGRVLRSADMGKTWDDKCVCMDFSPDEVLCFEQRMCKLESGTLVCIGWNENTKTGERYPNHFTFSTDNGKTWSKPQSTGIMGQASSVCALDGERLLSLHSLRRDTDTPGIYGCIVDFSKKTWNIVEEKLLWQPETPIVKNKNSAEIFAYLKFGQPSAIKIDDNALLMTHWCSENEQYKTVVSRIEL